MESHVANDNRVTSNAGGRRATIIGVGMKEER